MPDCFTSPEYELPCSEGFYEIADFFGRQAVTWFDGARGVFLPVSGIIGVIGWRQALPDAQDIEEFRRREEERRKWMQKALTV